MIDGLLERQLLYLDGLRPLADPAGLAVFCYKEGGRLRAQWHVGAP